MTADPFMERARRRILDAAGLQDVTVAEAVDWHTASCPSRTDANGDEWTDTFGYESDAGRWFDPSDWLAPTPLPTSEQYADAERLLRSRGPLDADAARLRCWIADTRPLAVKAGWNDDEDPLIEYPTPLDWQDIIDSRVLADLASRAPRPSLWTRIAGWFR